MQDISNDTLIKASEGDIDAFKELYDASCGYVYNIALRVTGNREDAQEVTQDVFIKIHKHLKSFRFRANIKTWIYRITVNTAINTYKRRTKEVTKKSDYDDNILNIPVAETLKKRMDEEANQVLVNKLLGLLNPQQKACVILKDLQALSYKEIADTLRININTVRSRLKRAREAMLNATQKGVI